MSTTVLLLEYVAHTGALEVDEARGVLRNVRILGLESANGRSYDREAVKRAIPLYEGRQVNLNHPGRSGEATSVERRIGWLESVRQEADGGLRGNLQYLKRHPWSPAVVEVALRNPRLLGLSHNASGRERRGANGKPVIESIEAVHSVDLVADPATVSGLHEGKKMAQTSTVGQLIEDLRYVRPGYSRALREMAEAGLMDADMPMASPEPPAEGGDEADHETALNAGFEAAVMAIFRDTGLDWKGKVKKFRDILKAQEKLLGNGSATSASDGAGESDYEAKEEGRRMKLELTGLRLLMESGITRPDTILLKALQGCRDEAEIRQVVESARGRQASTQKGARSAAPAPRTPPRLGASLLKEDRKPVPAGDALVPDDPRAVGRWLQGG